MPASQSDPRSFADRSPAGDPGPTGDHLPTATFAPGDPASGRPSTTADRAAGLDVTATGPAAPSTPALVPSAGLDVTATGTAGLGSVRHWPAIPGYEFLERLGGGGMGDVWRVRDPLDQERALKTIRVDRLSVAGKERFHAEAKAMKRVEHPHIAPVHAFHWHGDTPFFLMDVYPATLQQRSAEYQADPAEAVRLMAAVAEAVGAMHAKGYIHRDLKPGNVLLTADGTPKVSDLGLAKLFAEAPSEAEGEAAAPGSAETRPAAAGNTLTGAVMGTRPYMAPEQAAGLTRLANPTWDVFALGVMLHELLTGRRPPSSDAPELLLDPGRPDNPPPSTFKPDLDPKVERVIRKCLARDEADRYTDGATVAADLKRISQPRPRWHYRVIVAAGLAAAGLVIAGSLGAFGKPVPIDPGPAYETAYREIRDQLARNETAELVGKTGLPRRAYRTFLTRDHVEPYLAEAAGPAVINSTNPVLLQFIDDPGISEYIFEADILQGIANPSSQVGLCQGIHQVDTSDGTAVCFSALTYNRHSGAAPGGRLSTSSVAIRRYVTSEGPAPEGNFSITTQPLDLGDRDPNKWVSIRAQVTAAGTAWTLNGKPVCTVARPLPAAIRNGFFANILKPRNPGQFDLAPTAGLGLFVSNSSTRFRNVRVIPGAAQ